MTSLRAFNFKDAADRLSLSQETLRRMVKAGQIKQVKITERRIVIPEAEIVRLLNDVGAPA